MRPWVRLSICVVAACGPAADPDTPDRDGDWVDHGGEEIPPPISEGWPIRGGDPDADHQRVACIEEVDISRAHVSRAIDSARAVGAHDRLKCLAREATFLRTMRLELATAAGEPQMTRACCLGAQDAVRRARRCR